MGTSNKSKRIKNEVVTEPHLKNGDRLYTSGGSEIGRWAVGTAKPDRHETIGFGINGKSLGGTKDSLKPKLSDLLWRPSDAINNSRDSYYRPKSSNEICNIILPSLNGHPYEPESRPMTCTCLHGGNLDEYIFMSGKCGKSEVLPTITETSSRCASSLGSEDIPLPYNVNFMPSPSPQPFDPDDVYQKARGYFGRSSSGMAFMYINENPYAPESRQANRTTAAESKMKIRRQSQPSYNIMPQQPQNQTPSTDMFPSIKPNQQKITITERPVASLNNAPPSSRAETHISTTGTEIEELKENEEVEIQTEKQKTSRTPTYDDESFLKRVEKARFQRKCMNCYSDWFSRNTIQRQIAEKQKRSIDIRNLLKKKLKLLPPIKRPPKRNQKYKRKSDAHAQAFSPWNNLRFSDSNLNMWNEKLRSCATCSHVEEQTKGGETFSGPGQHGSDNVYKSNNKFETSRARLPSLKSSNSRSREQTGSKDSCRRKISGNQRSKKMQMSHSAGQ